MQFYDITQTISLSADVPNMSKYTHPVFTDDIINISSYTYGYGVFMHSYHSFKHQNPFQSPYNVQCTISFLQHIAWLQIHTFPGHAA